MEKSRGKRYQEKINEYCRSQRINKRKTRKMRCKNICPKRYRKRRRGKRGEKKINGY
jgi:hypothetical protein